VHVFVLVLTFSILYPLVVYFDIRDNEFTGQLPSEIGHMWNMTRMQMKNNKISGTVPPEFGRLDQMEQWTLEGNYLTGEIPFPVCDLLQESLRQFVVDCFNERDGTGFNCEPQCCTICRDVK
jgi:hypothetical protein